MLFICYKYYFILFINYKMTCLFRNVFGDPEISIFTFNKHYASGNSQETFPVFIYLLVYCKYHIYLWIILFIINIINVYNYIYIYLYLYNCMYLYTFLLYLRFILIYN